MRIGTALPLFGARFKIYYGLIGSIKRGAFYLLDFFPSRSQLLFGLFIDAAEQKQTLPDVA